jgi:hypothetical protein
MVTAATIGRKFVIKGKTHGRNCGDRGYALKSLVLPQIRAFESKGKLISAYR